MSLGHEMRKCHPSLINNHSPRILENKNVSVLASAARGILLMVNSDLRNTFVLFTQEICKISGRICGHIAAIVGPGSPDIDND